MPDTFMRMVFCCLFIAVSLLSFNFTAAAETQEEAVNESLLFAEANMGYAENPPEAEETAAEEEKTGQFTVDSYLRFTPSRRAEEQSGKVEIIEAGSEYKYKLKAFGKLPVGISFASEYVGIENTTVVPLPAHLTTLSMGVDVTFPLFKLEDTYVRLGIMPSFYTDNWSADSSAFRMPLYAMFIHKYNEKLTLLAGIGVYPDFETEVWPVLGLIYKPNEKLAFNLIPPRPNVTYALNDKISLFAEGGITSGEYEVGRNGDDNVVLKYRAMRLGTGVEYKLNKFISASVTTGGTFGRRLKYRDGVGKVDIKDGFYSEFRLNIAI